MDIIPMGLRGPITDPKKDKDKDKNKTLDQAVSSQPAAPRPRIGTPNKIISMSLGTRG